MKKPIFTFHFFIIEKVNKSSVAFARIDVKMEEQSKMFTTIHTSKYQFCVVILKSKKYFRIYFELSNRSHRRIESLLKHLTWNILQK